MCGIVGHLGPRNSVEIVMEGLKRLEYRGYDSAGICFVNEKNQLSIFKKSGKLENLRGLIEKEKIIARSCIGHTRWATHGEVNDVNSHPHNSEDIALVHNGIIENAEEIRAELLNEGVRFQSETDSEVFLGLLTFLTQKKKMNIMESIALAFKRIRGNSAFVILNRATSEIFAVKRGAPLVCGINDISSEVLVSSDPYALIGVVDKLYFPEDEIICYLSAANKHLLRFFDLNLSPSKRYLSKKQEMSFKSTEKGNFEHFMLKEIHEQPELTRGLVQFYFHGEGKEILQGITKLRPERIILSACGTAYYAGLVIRNFLETINGISCIHDLASEFRYRRPLVNARDLAIFISQSGETADTLAAQALCKELKVETLSVVNVEGSSLYRQCHHNLLIRAGIEVGVASTKAFTQQVLTGRILSHILEGNLSNQEKTHALIYKINILAERIDELLSNSSAIQEVAQRLYDKKGFFFTGRGSYFPIALEGALKLKEIAYVHAEGYAAGELKHGPIALIDHEMVNMAVLGEDLFEKSISNVQEIKARKGIIVVIGPDTYEKELKKISDYAILLNLKGLDELSPLLLNIVNQLFAYHVAKCKGTDIDKPRNLAKSVTVE
ncbi:MAG: glutamine--fructose-6-phosphate transaminase (isomerizing) [Bdellovibrio sp.]|nr:glutamine--fructose-6-phosphate transaminase (isomerizing) [Bdellovibrio sp.]